MFAVLTSCSVSALLRSTAATLIIASTLDVSSFAAEANVSFTNDVVPVLTKAGCNAGICHAKACNGQNGFQLSLFGYEPSEDFDHIVNEGRGRRISIAAPERSLLLQKASGRVAHGGGVRLEHGTEAYMSVSKWIGDGARNDAASAPKLKSLRIEPQQFTLTRNSQRQLRVTATYSDGRIRDVTRSAVYESNDLAMAEATDQGLVGVFDIAGNVAVMVRYQGLIAVASIAVPLGDSLERTCRLLVRLSPHEPNVVRFRLFGSRRCSG